MTAKPQAPQKVVDRYWLEWFAGFESRRHAGPVPADEFLPDLLRRARALKAEMTYLNSCMVCR